MVFSFPDRALINRNLVVHFYSFNGTFEIEKSVQVYANRPVLSSAGKDTPNVVPANAPALLQPRVEVMTLPLVRLK